MEELKRRLVNYLMEDDYSDLEATKQIYNAKIITKQDVVTIYYLNGVIEKVQDDGENITQLSVDISNRA